MLSFVGLGLYDEMDVSVKGLAAIRDADLVYAEFYTSHLAGATPERLAEFYGKEVRILSREEVEVSPEGWIGKAREKKVAFLVGGDPMISTTHLDLRLRALRMGIVTRVIHSSSIVTAVSGLTGLQNYRFARSTSIPYPYVASGKRIVATSPYDVVVENLDRNLHTLLFLDIQPDRYMTASEGAALLHEGVRCRPRHGRDDERIAHLELHGIGETLWDRNLLGGIQRRHPARPNQWSSELGVGAVGSGDDAEVEVEVAAGIPGHVMDDRHVVDSLGGTEPLTDLGDR